MLHLHQKSLQLCGRHNNKTVSGSGTDIALRLFFVFCSVRSDTTLEKLIVCCLKQCTVQQEDVCSSPNIISVIKSRRMRLVAHVACIGR